MVDLRTRPFGNPPTPGDSTASQPQIQHRQQQQSQPGTRVASDEEDSSASGNQRQHPSPRKLSTGEAARRSLPSPQSLSPTKPSPPTLRGETSSLAPRLPPSFETTSKHSLVPPMSSRYGGVYTLHSPYRPGEYQRSECAPSERTRIERKLFEEEGLLPTPIKGEASSSSPLAPAFEAKMVLRNGASVDLISWLRTNFHHQPPPHTPVTSFMSLVHVQRLLQERFPRVPEPTELRRAVLVAFPHSDWEEPADGNMTAQDPPIMRGLTWHGRDVAEEDDRDATPRSSRPHGSRHRPQLKIEMDVFGSHSGGTNGAATSRSPSNSPLVSPVSTSTRRALPDTPARSVLDDFAEIVTRTPVAKECGLELEPLALAPGPEQYGAQRWGRKRPASQSPDRRADRATTPDALQELLDAAEAVEGSPLNSILSKHERGHKRRRTIGGPTHDYAYGRPAPVNVDHRRSRSVRGTASPQIGSLSFLNQRSAGSPPMDVDEPVSPLVSDESAASQLASMAAPWAGRRGPSSSTASQLSVISESVAASGPTTVQSPVTQPKPSSGRKVNELPTSSQGQYPGIDCKPPYPYHEMIRFAIEKAPDRKLQLAQIYSSIADRFPFFKTLDEKKTAGWQNSIRHNLSLKKMFVRVNKADGAPDDSGGKGGWWTVQPGVPDEGRPGRKAKAKRAKEAAAAGSTNGDLTNSVAGSVIGDNDTASTSSSSTGGTPGRSAPKLLPLTSSMSQPLVGPTSPVSQLPSRQLIPQSVSVSPPTQVMSRPAVVSTPTRTHEAPPPLGTAIPQVGRGGISPTTSTTASAHLTTLPRPPAPMFSVPVRATDGH